MHLTGDCCRLFSKTTSKSLSTGAPLPRSRELQSIGEHYTTERKFEKMVATKIAR